MLFSYVWYAIYGLNTKECRYVVCIHVQERERQTERESNRELEMAMVRRETEIETERERGRFCKASNHVLKLSLLSYAWV